MPANNAVSFWIKSAQLDKKTARDLFKSKNYVGSLFFVHLYLEKILKGLVQKTSGKIPPYTHDLLVLSKMAGLALNQTQADNLTTINTFNIRARYADYKFSFHKKARRPYAEKFIKIAEGFYTWFSSQF